MSIKKKIAVVGLLTISLFAFGCAIHFHNTAGLGFMAAGVYGLYLMFKLLKE